MKKKTKIMIIIIIIVSAILLLASLCFFIYRIYRKNNPDITKYDDMIYYPDKLSEKYNISQEKNKLTNNHRFVFSSKGNYLYYKIFYGKLDFYLYDYKQKTTTKLNDTSYDFQKLISELNVDSGMKTRCFKGFILDYYNENNKTIYCMCNINDWTRKIFSINTDTNEIKYTDNIEDYHDFNKTFGYDNNNNVYYYKRVGNYDSKVYSIYKYNFDTNKEEVYINNARYPLTSPDGTKLLYEIYDNETPYPPNYIVLDLLNNNKYVINVDKYAYLYFLKFSASGKYIMLEYDKDMNDKLFSYTKFYYYKLDYTTGDIELIKYINESGCFSPLFDDVNCKERK